MTNPLVELQHLGPYEIKDVTDMILNDLVIQQDIPVIVKQTTGGITRYAVLATKNLRIVCAGCFRRDMRITDTTRCKKCASFVKHWDSKDGIRRLHCKGDGDSTAIRVTDEENVASVVEIDSETEIEKKRKRTET